MSNVSCQICFYCFLKYQLLNYVLFLILSFLLSVYCIHIYIKNYGLIWNKAFTIVIVSLACFLDICHSFIFSQLLSNKALIIISSEKKLLVSLFVDSKGKLFSLLWLPMSIRLVITLGSAIVSTLCSFCISAPCLLFVQLSGILPSFHAAL